MGGEREKGIVRLRGVWWWWWGRVWEKVCQCQSVQRHSGTDGGRCVSPRARRHAQIVIKAYTPFRAFGRKVYLSGLQGSPVSLRLCLFRSLLTTPIRAATPGGAALAAPLVTPPLRSGGGLQTRQATTTDIREGWGWWGGERGCGGGGGAKALCVVCFEHRAGSFWPYPFDPSQALVQRPSEY